MNKNLFKQQRDIARKKYFLRKYQRALDNLALHSIRSEDVETIQELIDRANNCLCEYCLSCGFRTVLEDTEFTVVE